MSSSRAGSQILIVPGARFSVSKDGHLGSGIGPWMGSSKPPHVDLQLDLSQYRVMFLAFLESFKYSGHLLPLSFLRLYVGYSFFEKAWDRIHSDFLIQPRLAAAITEWLPQSSASVEYQHFVEATVVPNWKFFAYVLVYAELAIALSLVFGFLVRPISLLGMFLSVALIYTMGQPVVELHQLHLVLFVTLFWFGAGRCLGLDYFFYKRRRGLWW